MRWIPVLLLFVSATMAQEPAPSKFDAQAYVARQFGIAFQAAAEIAPMFGDFDGDGVQDVAIVATNKNPMSDAGGSAYKVSDPYNSYFGFGDPKITIQFGAKDPGASRHILIAHSWQQETPKAKFVIVNLPFKTIELSHFTYKKKTSDALIAHEVGGLSSAVFWDGKKKYRWEPLMYDE